MFFLITNAIVAFFCFQEYIVSILRSPGLFFGFSTFLFFALSAQILRQPQETSSECWSFLRAGTARVGSVSGRPWTGLDAPTDIYGWRLTNYGSSLSRNDGKMARFAVCAASS